jgi:hypothetical protein
MKLMNSFSFIIRTEDLQSKQWRVLLQFKKRICIVSILTTWYSCPNR